MIKIWNPVIQGGQGFELAEIDMTGCEPYKCFSVSRFGPIQPKEEVSEELELELELQNKA